MRVHDHQQVPNITQPQRHKPQLVVGAGIPPRQREVISQGRGRLSEADAMGAVEPARPSLLFGSDGSES
jgi:hypothetical protein